MAELQSNAPARPSAGAPRSGVIHVRTRLTADFTVVANALAQRPGSAVTVGVATYILSLPDGAPVTITALCAHFTEGEILISRALRELEAAGYLERRKVRDPRGTVRTETYFHDVPPGPLPEPPTPPEPPRPPRPRSGPAPATDAGRTQSAPSSPEAPQRRTEPVDSLDAADPRAVAVLTSLRLADPRLVLSRREVADLAPAVAEWLAAGITPAQLTRTLTTALPDRLRARPSRILAFRLAEPPLPATRTPAPPPAVLPWQTCDGGCERAFRAAQPGSCRDCRAAADALAPAC